MGKVFREICRVGIRGSKGRLKKFKARLKKFTKGRPVGGLTH